LSTDEQCRKTVWDTLNKLARLTPQNTNLCGQGRELIQE
jgi:hypothetical protein